MGGLQKIQSELARPVFIFVVDAVSNDIFHELNAPDKRIEVVTDYFQSRADFSYLQPRDVRIVNVGFLPQPLFDSLLVNTTLPPVIEGANARSVVKATRGDFIPGGRHYILTDPSQEKAGREFQKEHILFEATRRALCTNIDISDSTEISSREETIAAFYRACLSHEMKGYFLI